MTEPLARIQQGATPSPVAAPTAPKPAAGASFAALLAARQGDGLRFSTHAQQRLARRGIDLDPGDLARLDRAVDQAGARGGRESLILLDELALVVSINSRTVITALDTSGGGNVFTNVDSVVIAPHRQ